MGQLDSRKFSSISHLPFLESIDENSMVIPSLESFEVVNIARLITWVYETTLDVFNRLESFKIFDYLELTDVPENIAKPDQL